MFPEKKIAKLHEYVQKTVEDEHFTIIFQHSTTVSTSSTVALQREALLTRLGRMRKAIQQHCKRAAKTDAKAYARQQLKITVVKAEGLPAMDPIGASDPYVILKVGAQIQQRSKVGHKYTDHHYIGHR